MIGRKISHYEILSMLGLGGMGVVYKARDTRLDRLVALKFLPADVDSDPVRRQRFVHEAKAASALNHPHIVTIYDIGEVGGLQFVAMELLEGQSLRERIGGNPFTVDEVLDLGVQITDALDAAHAQGILHRDIKPDNIFVTARGQAKLLDFGLAKQLSRETLTPAEDETRTSLTEVGTTVGTAAYMSPEQARNEPLDARTDVFSFGAVLYEMVTGRQAFRGSTAATVFDNVLNRRPPAVSESNPQAPAGLVAVIGKALQKDREARYASAAELRADLEQLRRDPRFTLAAPRTSARRRILAPIFVAVPVLLGLAFILGFQGLRERFGLVGAAHIGSIAVLPFANLSGNPQQEYFADGMTEALITELSKIRALKVISRTSAMRFKDRPEPGPQIARELGVDALIEGSVLRDGDQVRISVQLIDGRSDHHLWARNFDREMGRILALHSEVAQAIAAEIRITLTPKEQKRLESDRVVNPKAYELYVLGRHHWNRRNIEEYWLAIKTFQKALELDPGYAPAQAALAEAYMLLGEQGGMPQSEARTLAGTAISKALELDPDLAQVNTALGVWKLQYEWDWNGSEQALRRAIELNPGYSAAHQIYGRNLAFAGRFEEARREIQRARELDPLSSVLGAYVAQIDIFEAKYDDAVEHLQQFLELDTHHPLILHSLGEARLAQGKFMEAVTWFERSMEGTDEPSSHFIAMLGCAYARANRKRDALALLNRLQRRAEQGLVSAFDMAAFHVALGEKERALAWLEDGRKQRDVWLVELRAWPWFDSIGHDSRYATLLRQIGLPD